MLFKSLRAFFSWLVLGLLFTGAGCAPVSQAPAPQPVPSQPRGVLESERWLYADGEVYWLKRAGYEPERPLAEQDFVFGWQKGGLTARLWLLPAEGDLAAEAIWLAHRQGWLLETPRRIGWQGRAAWEAKVSDQVMAGRLRLMKTDENILAVAALAPEDKAQAKAPELAAMIESLRLLSPGDVLHTVRYPEETLSVLSMWYTGTVRNWPLLQKYNKLTCPKLKLGQDILIPAKLVWRWDPLPGWLVRQYKPRKIEETPAKQDEPSEQPRELELQPAGPK